MIRRGCNIKMPHKIKRAQSMEHHMPVSDTVKLEFRVNFFLSKHLLMELERFSWCRSTYIRLKSICNNDKFIYNLATSGVEWSGAVWWVMLMSWSTVSTEHGARSTQHGGQSNAFDSLAPRSCQFVSVAFGVRFGLRTLAFPPDNHSFDDEHETRLAPRKWTRELVCRERIFPATSGSRLDSRLVIVSLTSLQQVLLDSYPTSSCHVSPKLRTLLC